MRGTILVAALALNACDGPRENAGERADFDAGVVNSEDTLRKGPAERLGEKQDAAIAAEERAAEAEADALDAMADEKRARADHEARELENRAGDIRAQ